MRNVWLGVGLVVLWALVGWMQTYGPGEIQYGGITLRFSGRLTTAGTCSPATQPGPMVTQIHCQVPEGAAGTIELTATRTPAGAVIIRMESPPAGWSSSLWTPKPDGTWVDSRSPVASGLGTIVAQYRFTPPAGSAGRRFELRFKAWTAGVIGELELKVILDIVRAVAPTPPPTEPTVPPSYGPFSGTTDGAGRFAVPIPTLPNTSVTGKLTECTVRPLPSTSLSVTLIPKSGVTTLSRADQIGAVRVSSSGYVETEIVQLMLTSSMDLFGRIYTTVDVGTVCLRPTAPTPPVTQPVTPTGPITGKTDGEGKFTASPLSGVTVTGRLTECTVKPIPNQEFTLTLVPKGAVVATAEDIAGFIFRVPGYADTTVTKFSMLSLFGLTWYDTGTVCLVFADAPCKTCLVIVFQYYNMDNTNLEGSGRALATRDNCEFVMIGKGQPALLSALAGFQDQTGGPLDVIPDPDVDTAKEIRNALALPKDDNTRWLSIHVIGHGSVQGLWVPYVLNVKKRAGQPKVKEKERDLQLEIAHLAPLDFLKSLLCTTPKGKLILHACDLGKQSQEGEEGKGTEWAQALAERFKCSAEEIGAYTGKVAFPADQFWPVDEKGQRVPGGKVVTTYRPPEPSPGVDLKPFMPEPK